MFLCHINLKFTYIIICIYVKKERRTDNFRFFFIYFFIFLQEQLFYYNSTFVKRIQHKSSVASYRINRSPFAIMYSRHVLPEAAMRS